LVQYTAGTINTYTLIQQTDGGQSVTAGKSTCYTQSHTYHNSLSITVRRLATTVLDSN